MFTPSAVPDGMLVTTRLGVVPSRGRADRLRATAGLSLGKFGVPTGPGPVENAGVRLMSRSPGSSTLAPGDQPTTVGHAPPPELLIACQRYSTSPVTVTISWNVLV